MADYCIAIHAGSHVQRYLKVVVIMLAGSIDAFAASQYDHVCSGESWSISDMMASACFATCKRNYMPRMCMPRL